MNEGGIRIGGMRFHWAACALAIGMLILGYGGLLAVYFVSLLWHEGAHTLCARSLGHSVPEMEWTPFGAVARIEDWHHIPYGQQLFIALAGPLASLVGALLCLVGLYVLPASCWGFLISMMKAHLFLLLFNIFPVLPMDGGRISCAILAKVWNPAKAAAILSRLGIGLGLGLAAAAVYLALAWHVYNLSLAITGCYLAYSASTMVRTTANECLRGLMERHILLEKRGALPLKWLAVDSRQSVRYAARLMEPGCFHQMLLIDPHTHEIVGKLNENQLYAALLANQEAILTDLMK